MDLLMKQAVVAFMTDKTFASNKKPVQCENEECHQVNISGNEAPCPP